MKRPAVFLADDKGNKQIMNAGWRCSVSYAVGFYSSDPCGWWPSTWANRTHRFSTRYA